MDKKAKKSNTVMFAVDTNDAKIKFKPKDSKFAKIKNEPKDAKLRSMDAYYGLNSKLVKSWVVVGNLAARVKDQNHVANGVATSTSLVGDVS